MKNREITETTSIRQFIIIAYKELLAQHSPNKISVQQIAARAGISRSTFYLHFQHKDAVLHVITELMLKEFISYYYNDNHNYQASAIHTTTKICAHILLNKDFYKERMKDTLFKQMLYGQLYEALISHLKNEALATFTAYGTIGYLFHWVGEGCQTPAQEIAAGLCSIGELRLQTN